MSERLDWRQIRVGDLVEKVSAGSAPTGREEFAFTSLSDGKTYLAGWDDKSAIMAQRHLLHWARAGCCTTTLAEARRMAATRGR